MGFFGMGFWEIMVVLLVILLVVGPNRLPEIARKMGQTLRAIRKASNEITSGLTRDLKVEEFKSDPLEQSEKAKPIENQKEYSTFDRTSSQDQQDSTNEPGEGENKQ